MSRESDGQDLSRYLFHIHHPTAVMCEEKFKMAAVDFGGAENKQILYTQILSTCTVNFE